MSHAARRHRALDREFSEALARDGGGGDPGGGGVLVRSRERKQDLMTMGDQNRGRRSAGQPKIKLLELWQRTSSTSGRPYLNGFLGKLRVVAFAETRPHPKQPGEEVTVWSVYASEAENRRQEDG